MERSLGRALITKSTPNCADVTWLFDPAILIDDDGSAYLYFGGGIPGEQYAHPKTARVVKLKGQHDKPWMGRPSRLTHRFS